MRAAWYERQGDAFGYGMSYPRVIPHSDGAGTIDRVGHGVPTLRIGEQVWCYGPRAIGPSARPPNTSSSWRGRPCRCPTACPLTRGPASSSSVSPPTAASRRGAGREPCGVSPGWGRCGRPPGRLARPTGRGPCYCDGAVGRGRGRHLARFPFSPLGRDPRAVAGCGATSDGVRPATKGRRFADVLDRDRIQGSDSNGEKTNEFHRDCDGRTSTWPTVPYRCFIATRTPRGAAGGRRHRRGPPSRPGRASSSGQWHRVRFFRSEE
jgi:hypothetical protein